ncbi:MAG: class I SAM-dependent methyltransferase [bacterium]|nr:class I SAM-dependent methyltransferase [bacterium]
MSGDYHGHPRREMLAFVPADARRVLDLGCGSGAFGAGLKADRGDGVEVWGMELDPDAAARAGQVLDRVLAGDVRRASAELVGERFDRIVLNDVLEHLPDPGELLRDLLPLLAPGGRLVASLPNVRYFFNVKDLALHGRWDYTDEGILDRTHLRFFTRSSMGDLFAGAGYVVERQVGINTTDSRAFHLFDLLTLGRFADMGHLQFACVARPAAEAGS